MKLEIEKGPVAESEQPLTYTPQTPLGEKLLALRARIIAEGEPLLSWEEVQQEIASRRGGSSQPL